MDVGHSKDRLPSMWPSCPVEVPVALDERKMGRFGVKFCDIGEISPD